MRLPLLLAAIVTIAAAEQQQQPPSRALVPELNVGGPDESRDDYTFSAISGLAFDSSGRMLVSDLKENVIRLYDSTGKFAFQFGRPGQGPGEFSGAMSGVFSPDGLFWVRDEAGRRWNAFDVAKDRALPKLTVRYDHDRPFYRFNPVGFDAAGNLWSTGSYRDEATGGFVAMRVKLDRAGRVLATDTIPLPKGDSLGDFVMKRERKEGGRVKDVSTFWYYQPYGSGFSIAHAPNGDYARTVTGRYDVEWRAADGRVLRHLRRNVQGPELSDREKRVGNEDIDDFLKRAQIRRSELPHGLPPRKAPIRQLAFDQLGRLWVERRVADGADREADLYDASGRWIAVVHWPRHMDVLVTGLVAARGNQVLATARDDSSEVEWVVRLRLK